MNDRDIIIPVEKANREWQCTECGFVLESETRPDACADCNCVNGDMKDPLLYLFIPREACGWFG